MFQMQVCVVVFVLALGSRVIALNDNRGRIFNGDTAGIGKYPYQVRLALSKIDGRFTSCGGSLIAREWILTAAHCIDDVKSVRILFGTNERESADLELTVGQENLIMHEKFRRVILINDIGLIRIPPVNFTRLIEAVPLPTKSYPSPTYTGNSLVASGWGRMTNDGWQTQQLQFTKLKIMSNKDCVNIYGKIKVRDTNLCANATNKAAVCYGDSGGPGVMTSTGELVGIISFGSEHGCEDGRPSVFTRVTNYLDWIEEQISFA